ncbi:MAG: carbohydrate porin [Deltaproteobacteria bacterium]|nr:carbohydrate porin [Deltaproteobacteria bacterium]
MQQKMKVLLMAWLLALFGAEVTSAAEDTVLKEIQELKTRIEALENRLETQNHLISTQSQALVLQQARTKELAGISEAFDRLDIALGATSVIQGSSGNDDTRGHDDSDASYSVDIEITAAIGENGTALLYLEGGEGSGLNNERQGFQGCNADALDDDADLQISELWYEQRFFRGRLTATFGKMDVTRWFDANAVANDETLQFLADAFVNNIAVEFPDYAYGARMTLGLTKIIDLSLGLLEADSDFEDIFDENFMILELAFRPVCFGHPGNYRLYGWYNSGDKTSFKHPAATRKNGGGFGLSFDQQLTDQFTVFARYGRQDDDVYEVKSAWSVGAQLGGARWGRSNDMLGVAYGSAHTGTYYRRALRSGGLRSAASEKTFEVYYRFRLNDHISLSPDLQITDAMAGQDNQESVTILGLRAKLDF